MSTMPLNTAPLKTDPLLSARDLTKRFGGLAAVQLVSVDLWPSQIHAVIGPNGAGKSTLTNLLSGDLPATSGTVTLRGQDISGWTPEKISSNGLGRSYQKTNIFRSFSIWENVRLAAQSRSQPGAFNPLRWFHSAAHMREVNERAERAIELAGLHNRRQHMAGAASHGEQRQLEIAMTLATEPSVLLLDEPLAGMGPDESERMLSLLQSLRGETTLLLVEHDMNAVFRLADRISTLVAGRVIACGTPEEIRQHPEVRLAYLGDDEEAAA